jgi:hypothetical protein
MKKTKEIIKTLNISESNWKDINMIRLNFSCKTLNDVITLLIDTFLDNDTKTPYNTLKTQKNTIQEGDI